MKVVSSLILSLLCATVASADKFVPPPMLQYAAKFVCGDTKIGTGNANVVAANGQYHTAINVHNPSEWETASFVKKFAVGLPEERVGPISKFINVRLKPDETMQIDCGNIWKHLGMTPNAFVEGFAVIETRYELDVVSVYTAANGPAHEVSSIDTERVPYRFMKACPTQTSDLSTGATTWMVVVDPAGGTPRPADVMSPVHPWGAQSGTQFVSFNPSGDTSLNTSSKTWTYESCFCTCLMGATPQLNITKMAADDEAKVFLNNNPLGSFVGIATAAAINSINTAAATHPTYWKPGQQNCLQVEVKDTQFVLSGFGMTGSVTGASTCQ